MIEVRHLTKRYGRVTAVDDVSFTVRPGAVTGFLGPNGAGKSTTLQMVLGLTRPDAGRARIDGRAYRDLDHPLRHVGAVLETAVPHRGLRAVDHLAWLARSNRIPARRVGEALDLVGLAGVARRRVGTLSLGTGQRLGLAAALLGDPAVLVLDEPVNGLDAEGIVWLRALLRGMADRGRTVLVSSHLLAETALVADRVVVIHRGRLLADDGTADVVRRHGRPFVRVRGARSRLLAGELERAGARCVVGADGSLEVEGLAAADISRLAAATGVVLDELSTRAGSLEDAFLGLLAAEGSRG